MENKEKVEKEPIVPQVNPELKKSIGFLNFSTGIFYMALSVIYWIFFASLFSFLIEMIGDEYLVFVYIINSLFIFSTIVGALTIVFGFLVMRDLSLDNRLGALFKINSYCTLALFPIGTISGIITLKNHKSIKR